MRYSSLFGKTSKTATDEKIISGKLLAQAGFVKESTAGRYYFLPLGWRVMQKIMGIIKAEIDAIGGQEMIAPTLHPLELWQETNRTSTTGFELMKVKDRRGAEFALGGTAEEMFVDLVRKFNISYRDLPFHLYQFSTKFRDELRARGGILRVREFIMKDAYSFDIDAESFKKTYANYRQAYINIFTRMGFTVHVVESDNGYIGGEYCHEFVVDSHVGETSYLVDSKGYAAHEEVAVFQKDTKSADEEMRPLSKVEAVRGPTMEDGATFHKLPLWQQIKDVVYVDEKGRYVVCVIRGDLDVNEIKLSHLVGAITLTPATDAQIIDDLGSYPGFISPVGLTTRVREGVVVVIVGDDSLHTIKNAYGGANEKNTDYLNIHLNRDFTPDVMGDVALAKEGYLSQNGEPLELRQGIEVGNIFQLGLHYTNLMTGAAFKGSDGAMVPYYMGCYGIGLGRTMAAAVEVSHDERGIIWPKSIAPYMFHLVGIDMHDESVKEQTEKAYALLNVTFPDMTLFDDREGVRAGEKFADCDLIGCPIRIVVSPRTGERVEIKRRNEKESRLDHLSNLIPELQMFIANP